MKRGFITKCHAGQYSVFCEGQIYVCRARGKFRIEGLSPVAGDVVDFDEKENYLLKVLPRFNAFVRPPVANVEQLLIVASLRHPDVSLALINRFMTMAIMNGVKPVLAISKMDLVAPDDQDYLDFREAYANLDYQVFYFSNKTREGLPELLEFFQNKKTVIIGQSGVGKSSLINNLIPGYKQAIAEISEALGRGKHITRVSEYLPFKNGWVVDTPGFSLFDIEFTPTQLASAYPGFEPLFDKCRFRNCLHDHEKGCAIKEAVESGKINKVHYEAYLRLLKELQNKKEKY